MFMFSMPPATTISASPALISAAASMIDFMPDPQTRLIVVAREWRIGELVGQVLRENRPMLAMCRELGFTVATDPTDASVMQVRKVLPAG